MLPRGRIASCSHHCVRRGASVSPTDLLPRGRIASCSHHCVRRGASGAAKRAFADKPVHPSIEVMQRWIKEFHVQLGLCPYALKGLSTTKFETYPVHERSTKKEVEEMVLKEMDELVTNEERRWPKSSGTFMIFPNLPIHMFTMHAKHLEVLMRKVYKNRPPVNIFHYSPTHGRGFLAPFEALHLIPNEALGWAASTYLKEHPECTTDFYSHISARNTGVFDRAYDEGLLEDLIDHCVALREKVLGPRDAKMQPQDPRKFLSEEKASELNYMNLKEQRLDHKVSEGEQRVKAAMKRMEKRQAELKRRKMEQRKQQQHQEE